MQIENISDQQHYEMLMHVKERILHEQPNLINLSAHVPANHHLPHHSDRLLAEDGYI